VRILLLGSVNPLDFELSDQDYSRVKEIKFGRSVPVSDLAISLAELGHEVTIIGVAKITEPVLSLSTQNGVDLIYVSERRQEKLKAITFYSAERKSMLSQIALVKPDVLHAHWTYEYALTAQDSRLPHLITVHDEPWEIFKSFRNVYFFLRLLIAVRVRLRGSENLVFVSEYIRKLWNQRMFTSGGLVIPNMNRLGIAESSSSVHPNHVITVANADRNKNISVLLSAWHLVLAANPNLRLHLVGPGLGPEDSLASKLGREFKPGRVTWHGSITRGELANLYSHCKVLVHPSLHESFGLIYLEAFASNLGIITLAKSGSAAEVVADAGLILGDDSPKSLSDAILALTSNQKLLDQLTNKGRARLKLYSPTTVTNMYLSQYKEICG
jgi:glycosyltransferase involved in cell wall biosynthesis